MAETPSLLKVVDKVIETITDAISQLLGMVIVLQEKNAPIPATLSKTGKSVVEACDRLVSVAKELAAEEYQDFPDIEKEIVDAANDVSRAADTLESSIRNLQSSKDRQQGWNKLVDACKVIAEMTVLLLQIVYGAEVKRVFAMQKRADAKVVAVDISMVEEDRKAFAAVASAAATAAVELAEALRAKADETALPIRKQALLGLADALEQQAKEVMDRANELLRLPGDKGRKEKLQAALDKLKKTMKDALIPLQEEYLAACNAQKWSLEGLNPQEVQRMTTDPADKKKAIEQLFEAIKAGDKPLIREALDRVEWELDNVQALAKRILGVRPEASEALEQFNLRRRGLRPEVKEAEKDRSIKKLEGFWADLMDAQAKLMDEIIPIEDRVAQLINEQLGDMDRVKRALRKNDDGSAISITKNVFGTHKELMKAAEKCHNGWKKGRPKKMRECMQAANGVMGSYIKGVQGAVKEGNGKDGAYKDSQDLALAVEDVAAEALPIEEAVILAGELQVKDLRAQFDPNRAGWTELQNSIEERNPRIERLAREAKEVKDAQAQLRKLKIGKGQIPDDADVEEELRKLRSVAQQQKEEARSEGPEWLRMNLRHVEAVQDAVAAALTPKSRLVYLANKALEDLKLGSDADKFSRGPGQALSHHVERVIDEANKVAGSFYDGAARDRLKKLAGQMDPLLEELHAAAAKANRSPNNPDAQREFVKLNHRLADLTRQLIQDVVMPVSEIEALANRVIKGLDNQLNSIPKGDTGAVNSQNADLDDAVDRLADLAEFAAKHNPDYAAKHRIRQAGENLRRDQPTHAALSLKAVGAPKEAEPLREVKTVDRRLRAAVEALVGDTATPEAQLAAIARQLIAQVDQLTDGVRDGGDDIDVHTQASVEGALAKRLAVQADRIKQNLSDEALANLLEKAVQDVNDLLPHHVGSVHDVMQDPNKQEAQQALTSDAQALKDAVLAVVAASQPSAEEDLRAQRRAARNLLKEGAGKASAGEGAAAEAKGSDAEKRYRDVERAAREVGLRATPGHAPGIETAAFDVRAAGEAAPSALRGFAGDGAPESSSGVQGVLHKADAGAASIDRDAGARMKSEAKKMQRDLRGAAAALQKGDPQDVGVRLRSVANRFGELAQLAEAEAKSLGGADEEAILDAIAQLKAGIPELSDAAIAAMTSKWDPLTTGDAVQVAEKLEALAGSLADGSYKDEVKPGQAPKDDRRGKRLWKVSSPGFVGRDELAAADNLEALLPTLLKSSGPALEAALAKAEREVGHLGNAEPSAAARLAQMARLADADAQHCANEAADGKDVSRVADALNEAAQAIPRAAEVLLDSLPGDQRLHVQNAAQSVGKNVPSLVAAAKDKDQAGLAANGDATHFALDALAEALDPSAELNLLELRDKAGDSLEAIQQGKSPAKQVENLASLRLPTLRALGEALRRANANDDLKKSAEELGRLWASLPDASRRGNDGDLSAKAARMDALLDTLMQGTNAFPSGLARRIDLDLHRLQVAARAGDAPAAQSLAKGIISDLKDLEGAVDAAADSVPKDTLKKLQDAVKAAKAASAAVIKKVPEFLASPKDPKIAGDLDGACAHVRSPLASVVAAFWPDDMSKLRETARQIESSLASAREGDDRALDDALKRVPKLGQGPAVDAVRAAIQKCDGLKGTALENALAQARRKLWIAAREAPDTEAEGGLDNAKSLFAAESVRARKGVPRSNEGLVEAAKRLISGTRSNYKNQNMEGFDLSKLDAACKKAEKRTPRSLADVLADIRKARQARERERAAAAAAAAEPGPNYKITGGGAFGAMQDDINNNLKKMVVGSPLDFENEKTIHLIRTIAMDFGAIGQHAAEKKADLMIEAGRQASKHISDLVTELTNLAKITPDPRAADELVRSAQVLKDFSVRTKLFTSIKAASLNTKGGDEAMQTFSKELGNSILSCVKLFYVARIKVYEKESKGAKK